MKTRTVPIGPVLPPKTQHFKCSFVPPIKYLSSNRIVTWSIRRLCRFSRSFTSCSQIWDLANIRGVAIDNMWISFKICLYFTAALRISVGLQIWMLELKELAKLHHLRIHHGIIWSELKKLDWSKSCRNHNIEPQSGFNPDKKPQVWVRCG